MRQDMVTDTGYAKAFENQLLQKIARAGFEDLPGVEDGYDEINVAETYDEALVSRTEAGLVLEMASGAEVRLTIQALTPRGDR